MKKIMITAYSLELGGIEKALINLLHMLDKKKYDITLVLERCEGIFLNQVPREIKVVEYKVYHDQNVLVRKVKNRLKLMIWKIRHKNKYDFAISFTTYSRPGAHIALNASAHNALFVHSNYEQVYEGDIAKMKTFFDTVQARKFENLVFVSRDNKNAVCKYLREFEKKSFVCNNIINYDEMKKKSEENIAITKKKLTFLHVGRHDEHSKRISRIIEASSKLFIEGYHFEVWLLGDGVDHQQYLKMVQEKKLDDVVLFLGKCDNPFPYYKACDCVLLSSLYEGYPVVFLEAMAMEKPIVTTKVSDYEEIEEGFGIVVDNSKEGVYLGMKKYLDGGYSLEKRFDPHAFNKEILKKLDLLIGGEYYERKD